ncbi:acyl-CoA thioesterase [Nocardia sp. NPDC055321]
MPELWSELLSCLDLRPMGGDPSAATALEFTGPNLRLPHKRIFGGQILAQFVRAAAISRPEKSVKSLHTIFLREGTFGDPIHYLVEPLRDGRSYSTVLMTARQRGEIIATCTASLHAAEAGVADPRTPAAIDLPGPEHLVRHELLPWHTRSRTDLNDPSARPAEYEVWMRTPPAAGDLAQALLAYTTDLMLIGTTLLPFDGIDQRGNGIDFLSAATSHTVWFHHPCDTGDWHLLRHEGVAAAHARSFGRGDVLAADGTAVASFAQEALLRFPA